MDVHEEEADAREFVKSFRTDLFDEEVFVFTPKGEVKTLPAGATPIDFAYAVHTDVGHRTVVRDHVFVASHAVISGFCEIGESSFVGVNATFNDGVKVAADNVIGSGALVVRDTEPGKVYVGSPARALPDKSSLDVRF